MAGAKPPLRVVVMGVSGSGKTVVGSDLAARLDCEFLDADDMHPASNVTKMSRGIPLDDEDRWPWLDRVSTALSSREDVIVACSALKRAYRDRIRSIAPDLVVVHLTGTPSLLAARIGQRVEHFMPSSLLTSQLDALEPLGTDERGFEVDIHPSPTQIVATIQQKMRTLA